MMFGGVMMIVFWGGIILLVILLVRSFGGSKTGGLNAHPRDTPLDILKERFAKGEIDKKEYDACKKTLSD
jgi:putative membrane protein